MFQLVLLCSAFQLAWLEVNGRRYEIGRGETKIGRDPEACKITLESKVCRKEKTLVYILLHITCALYFALVMHFTYFVIPQSIHNMIMTIVITTLFSLTLLP